MWLVGVVVFSAAALMGYYTPGFVRNKWTLNSTDLYMSLLAILVWPLTMPMLVWLKMAAESLPNPIVKMVLVPDNTGYWLVDSKGVAHAFGSACNRMLESGVTPTYKPEQLQLLPGGAILTAPDTKHVGDLAGRNLNAPLVGVVRLCWYDRPLQGYYVFSAAGEVFAFGDAVHHGQFICPEDYQISWHTPRPVSPETRTEQSINVARKAHTGRG